MASPSRTRTCPPGCVSDHGDPLHQQDEREARTALHAFRTPKRRRPLVVLPAELALAFTPERGWHYLSAPPAWWLEQQVEQLEEDERPSARLSLVPAPARASARVTACRPGSGPCRRRHVHASSRRSGS